MRKGTFVISILVFGVLLLNGRATATERPVVYGKHQWEWVAPAGINEFREWGGIYAAKQGSTVQLTDHPGDGEPNVSRDGSAIVFVRDGDLYAMRADGSQQHQLTDGPDLDERPQVSPDGRFVLFTRRPALAEARDLYVVSLLGGAPVQLTSSPEDDFEPSFSPNGRTIVFVRGLPGPGGGEFGGNADLFSIRSSGEGLTRLTHTPRDELRPRYFARGIVFQRRNEIHSPLFLFSMRSDGSDVKPLVRRKSNSRVGAVSPDGRLLLFNSNGIWKKRWLPSGSWSRAHRLYPGSSENLVFSPDGHRVAGTFTNTSSEVSPFHVLFSIDVSSGLGQVAIESWEPEEGSRHTAIGPVLGW